jgi:hypothetical protein
MAGQQEVAAFSMTTTPSPRTPTWKHNTRTTRLYMTKNNNNDDENVVGTSTTLVVGATGRIGQRVVRELLAADQPVRALVRNETKARELFFVDDDKEEDKNNKKKNLQLFVCDLGHAAKTNDTSILEQAVQGCTTILSVSGCLRFSKWTDFLLPWRIVRFDVSGWADAGHPYYGNYLAQRMLIDLAAKSNNNFGRFLRITGLSAGHSAFHPVSVLFGSIVSLSNRYHYQCEEYLRANADKVPYLILRPGGMENEDRVSSKQP